MCPWMGRRGVELVHGGLGRLVTGIAKYQSDEFKAHLVTLDRKTAADLLAEVMRMQADIADEVDFKLGVMWRQLPLKLVGFFGEAAGLTKPEVNKFISETCAEYDRIEDKSIVHRVARQILDSSSRIRSLLGMKVQQGCGMNELPELWFHIGAYAFGLLVSTKHEGDHITLKVTARAAIGSVLPSYLYARLRQKDNFSCTEKADFKAFGKRLWNRRGSREMAAILCLDNAKLCDVVRMPWPAKLRLCTSSTSANSLPTPLRATLPSCCTKRSSRNTPHSQWPPQRSRTCASRSWSPSFSLARSIRCPPPCLTMRSIIRVMPCLSGIPLS